MSYIDLQNPQPCQFPCKDVNAKTSPMLLPWRCSEGWWVCDSCAVTKGQTHMYKIMRKRKIVGTGTLPEWFREWGLFSVKRSNGSLTDMVIVDFACSFSQNIDNGGQTDGRVRLSEGAIFIDMCSEDQLIFKQVQLSNLYENNPSLYDNDCIALTLPPYVDDEAKELWEAAVTAAYEAGKKKISEPPADELTDAESDDEVAEADAEEITDPDKIRPGTPDATFDESAVNFESAAPDKTNLEADAEEGSETITQEDAAKPESQKKVKAADAITEPSDNVSQTPSQISFW